MFFILQAQPAQGPFGGMSSLIFMGLIMLVFWLFFIRPQAKKQKQQKLFIEDLKKGDKVVTIAGIHGRINRVNDDGTIDLEINPGSYIKMEKSAISLEMTQQVNKAATAPATTTEKK
jgi:preprotein translocase subunit YajC